MELTFSSETLRFPLSVPEVAACGRDADSEAPGEVGGEFIERRWRADGGAGKFCFLSIVSTVRWKRRYRDSARMSVVSRSMVPESSFTVRLC